MVLGLLARNGPMHGHKIRREAEATDVETWGGVSVGALYRELHRMEEEGLIEPVCSEQVGKRPERTVFAITKEGVREHSILTEKAMTCVARPADPVGVALLFGDCSDPEEFSAHLRYRKQAIENELESLTSERMRLEERGCLSPAAKSVFRRSELRLAAELSWHEELAGSLGKMGRMIEPLRATSQAS
jgi:DNA-binding PadR family transcriptional regulator